MKKYVKPELFVESYELSQHIAACGYDMVNFNLEDCAAVPDTNMGNPQLPPGFLFISSTACQVKPEMYCYENGTDQIRVFNS